MSNCPLIVLIARICIFRANGWNFMQLIQRINDHSMMMHVKFQEDSASCVEELLPLDCLIIN